MPRIVVTGINIVRVADMSTYFVRGLIPDAENYQHGEHGNC